MEDDIFFSESITKDSGKYILFELPLELLAEVEYSPLHVNGSPYDSAIVTGKQGSFLVKKGETSNSLLLVEKNTIFKVDHEIFTCEKIVPPLHQVFDLLNQSPYTTNDESKW